MNNIEDGFKNFPILEGTSKNPIPSTDTAPANATITR